MRYWVYLLGFAAFLALSLWGSLACREAAINRCHDKGGHVISQEWWQSDDHAGSFWSPSCVEGR